MKNLFIALMFALGLAVTPALAAPACSNGASFEEFAAAATEDFYVISGNSLEGFAATLEPIMGTKPAEIKVLVVPINLDPEDDNSVVFYTFQSDYCPYSTGQGYMTKDNMVNGLGSAATINDKMVILQANPDAKPKPAGQGI